MAPPDGHKALDLHNNAHPATRCDSHISIVKEEGDDLKRVLTEEQAYGHLGFHFSTRKKWFILTVIFIVQLSMNFNAAIFSNAIPGIEAEFGISHQTSHLGQVTFLIAYAVGCELWAPFSEEFGRKWVMQISLFLVNIFQIPIAVAGTPTNIPIFRTLGGLSSAGGSVTLGIIADMFEPERQQFAVAYVVLSSVAGSVIAPIFGGFIQTYLNWRWVFWISLIFGAFAQLIHLFVPETRSSNLLDRRARHLRASGTSPHLYGPNEIRGPWYRRISLRECATLMWRPYKFLLTEPIVTFLSLLSGFSDALIFTGLDSFPPILQKWHFSTIAIGLAFSTLLLGYFLGYLSFLPIYARDMHILRTKPASFPPERRLRWLLVLVLLEPLGLFGFAWTSLGPTAHIHWIAPLIFTTLIGIANFAIYLATVDYMIAAYGPYSASATGGNGFCRDLLAGLAALYSKPFYQRIDRGTKWQMAIPTFILTGIGLLLCVPVFVFYFYGAWFRNRSPFAMKLANEREMQRSRRNTPVPSRRESRAAEPVREVEME